MRGVFVAILALMSVLPIQAQNSPKIYWGDEVPKSWNGQWPEDLRTIPERTDFTRTMTTAQLHEYIAALKLKSENLHVLSMFTSPRGKVAPAVVIANPRI